MNESLRNYQEFIDNLVSVNEGVLGEWVTGRGWPKLPENEAINKLLGRLSASDKQIIRAMVEQSRLDGINDTLVYLSELGNLQDLRMSIKGVEIANEPYGTELYWDWHARSQGDNWPEHQLDPKYKD